MSDGHHNVYSKPGDAYGALGIADHYLKAILAIARDAMHDEMLPHSQWLEVSQLAMRALCRTNATGHNCLLVDSSHKSSLEQDRLNAEYFEDSQNSGPVEPYGQEAVDRMRDRWADSISKASDDRS